MNKESYRDSLTPDSSSSVINDNRLISSPTINPDDLFYPGTIHLTEYGSKIQKGLLHIQSLERDSDVNDPYVMSPEKREEELSEFFSTADSLGMTTQLDYWKGVVSPQFIKAIAKRNNEITENIITEDVNQHNLAVMDRSYPFIRYAKDRIGEIIQGTKKRIGVSYQIFPESQIPSVDNNSGVVKINQSGD